MAKKEYPGQLEDYAELKKLREEAQAAGDNATASMFAVAEQIAGLSYIADGIRYSLRRQSN